MPPAAAEGVTVIRNAAREPEIVDLPGLPARHGGAHVRGAGSGSVTDRRRQRDAPRLRAHRSCGDRIVGGHLPLPPWPAPGERPSWWARSRRAAGRRDRRAAGRPGRRSSATGPDVLTDPPGAASGGRRGWCEPLPIRAFPPTPSRWSWPPCAEGTGIHRVCGEHV